MKKYLIYELKKNAISAIVITAFSLIIYMAVILTGDYRTRYYDDYTSSIPNSPVGVIVFMLGALCFIVPILMFSFKMNARQVDVYYSMPIKREKLYLIKSIVGLLMVLVPYSITYWLGFLALLFKAHEFSMVHFFPLYLCSVPLAVLVFGINSFVFTRANKVIDGIIFIGGYTFIAQLFIAFVVNEFNLYGNHYLFSGDWNIYGAISIAVNYFESKISRNSYYEGKGDWIGIGFGILSGALAWGAFFSLIKKQKPELCEGISDTKFGYTSLIPAYIFLLSALVNVGFGSAIYFVLFAVFGAVCYIIYRRSVKLKLVDLASLGAALLLGMAFSVI